MSKIGKININIPEKVKVALAGSDINIEGKDFLAGKFSAADTITGHACIVTKNLGADLSDKPNIASYRERLLERQALKDALDIKQ